MKDANPATIQVERSVCAKAQRAQWVLGTVRRPVWKERSGERGQRRIWRGKEELYHVGVCSPWKDAQISFSVQRGSYSKILSRRLISDFRFKAVPLL